jgi:hypothetical protein
MIGQTRAFVKTRPVCHRPPQAGLFSRSGELCYNPQHVERQVGRLRMLAIEEDP